LRFKNPAGTRTTYVLDPRGAKPSLASPPRIVVSLHHRIDLAFQ